MKKIILFITVFAVISWFLVDMLITPKQNISSSVSENKSPKISDQSAPANQQASIDKNISSNESNIISLSGDTWKKMNVFLSNFSEAEVPFFNQGTLSNDELILFGIRHNIINNPGYIEKANLDKYNERISEKYVNSSVMKYFGRRIQENKTVKAYEIEVDGTTNCRYYLYRNGYYYIPLNDLFQIDPARHPTEECEKFTQAVKMQENSNSLYTVYFNIYQYYETSGFNGDIYGEDSEQWHKKYNPSAFPELSSKGIATIKKMEDGRYILIDYMSAQ